MNTLIILDIDEPITLAKKKIKVIFIPLVLLFKSLKLMTL